MDQVVSRLQIKFNNTVFKADAYKSCRDGKFTSDFKKKQFMDYKYWSLNPATGEFEFKAETCEENMETFP